MDKKLGYRNDRGRILKYPDHYADGKTFSRTTNPAPTMYWINHNYFIVMAINASAISEEGLTMFAGLAEEAEQERQARINANAKPTAAPVVVETQPDETPSKKDQGLPDDATALRILGSADAGLDSEGKPVKKTTAARTPRKSSKSS